MLSVHFSLELDIYIPSFKLAIELNGIFHYKPAFGIELFQKIQDRDKRKKLYTYQMNINLITVNISEAKNKKETDILILQAFNDLIFPILKQ